MNEKKILKHFGSMAHMAKELGVARGTVHHWFSGYQVVPVTRCLQIEQATNGAVTRKDLRPDDYMEIWPELEGR